MAPVIFIRIIFLASPIPISSVLGQDFCLWINAPALFSVGAGYLLSCFIAVYRALLISFLQTAKTLKHQKLIIFCLLLVGTVLTCLYTGYVLKFDLYLPSRTLCNHYSIEDLSILHSYMVRFFINYVTLCLNHEFCDTLAELFPVPHSQTILSPHLMVSRFSA